MSVLECEMLDQLEYEQLFQQFQNLVGESAFDGNLSMETISHMHEWMKAIRVYEEKLGPLPALKNIPSGGNSNEEEFDESELPPLEADL